MGVLIPSNPLILPVTPLVCPLFVCVHTYGLHLFLGESLALAPIDLSKATKLKDVVFRPNSRSVEWVVGTFRTITPKHQDLRQITIHMPYYTVRTGRSGGIRHAIRKTNSGEWWDVDSLLVQFWESRSIRPKVICTTKQGMEDSIGRLLPEITGRGIIDLVEYSSRPW